METDRQANRQGRYRKGGETYKYTVEEEKDKYLTITNTPLFLGVHKSQFGGSDKD